MNVRLQVDQALAAAAQQSAAARLQIPVDHGTVILELVSIDSIGVALDFLCFQSDKLASSSIDDLQKVSKEVLARVHYLFEPLGVLEIDRESCVVQLRSMPPEQELGVSRYYELWVRRGGEISLTRYQKVRGQMRERIASNLTREVVSRLASDFVNAVG